MGRKKTSAKKREWEHFGAAILETEIAIQSSINHEIKDKRYRHCGLPVYEFRRYISFQAVVIWPEEQVGQEIGFYIDEMPIEQSDQILADLHLKDKRTGQFRHQRYRGKSEPVYGEAKPIGWLEKAGRTEKGQQRWHGSAKVSHETRTDIMALLLSSKQTYFHPTGFRERKYIDLTNVSISLGDPGDWEEFQKLKASAH